MKVLVLGSGAREHAIAAHLQKSRSVERVVLAPGNALAASEVETAGVNATDPADVLRLVRAQALDFVVVGPEAPLLAGVVDALEAEGVLVLGPRKAAAALEGSKSFAKRTMQAAGVPTARFASVTSLDEAERFLAQAPGAYAVKADGLMAGKGVIVCDDGAEAVSAARELLGAGQGRLVIEQRLRGPEVSLIALCDGRELRLFPLARDHKRLLTGDRGKNTGGMGAFCPVVLGEREFEKQPIEDATALAARCIAPVLAHMAREGIPYRGFLYAGLMFDEGRPYVLEYNARLGDPETQVLLHAFAGDLSEAFLAAARGELSQVTFPAQSGAAACVVLAARGYPDAPALGDAIEGLERARARPDVRVYGAGVAEKDGRLVTAGGRVLSIVGHGESVAVARARAYEAVADVSFAGMQHRSDIAG